MYRPPQENPTVSSYSVLIAMQRLNARALIVHPCEMSEQTLLEVTSGHVYVCLSKPHIYFHPYKE